MMLVQRSFQTDSHKKQQMISLQLSRSHMAVHTKVLLVHVTLHVSMVRLTVLFRRYAYTNYKKQTKREQN